MDGKTGIQYKLTEEEKLKMKRSAIIEGSFRYSLEREWNPSKEGVLFVLLNPSTADDNIDDNTVKKCIGFAKQWGYGSLEIVNLFAYRATDPKVLFLAEQEGKDVIGPKNDKYIQEAMDRAEKTIVGWGEMGKNALERCKQVQNMLQGKEIECFGVGKKMQPKHPLMLKYTTPLQNF